LHAADIRAVYVESVENPTMRVNDLEGLAALTEPLAIPLIVDNTFATPYNTQPFRYESAPSRDVAIASLIETYSVSRNSRNSR
jgi:cystathionine beta-lyase/cystathionine gamma-synthase